MYSTCLFCNHDLGGNEVVEAFPVGRRLAFDAAKGRLWVVCRACERWNLTPLEERWEAVEVCERLFAGTRLRASTDNVGLARLPEGLELVRIGRALRPEFAAWRYGDQFGRRRRRQILVAGGGLVVLGGVIAGGAVAGVAVGSFGWLIAQAASRILQGNPNAVVARLAAPEGDVRAVRRKDLARVQVHQDGTGGMALLLERRAWTLHYTGPDAVRAAGVLLPHVNRFGAARADVQSAVSRIELAGDPQAFMSAVARSAERLTAPRIGRRRGGHGGGIPRAGLFAIDKVDRLALEMAAHEEQERRAMEGELADLERAWREAEEIAAIADDMFLPSAVTDRLDRLRGG